MSLRLNVSLSKNESFSFNHEGPTCSVGRDPACDLSLPPEEGDCVSWRHAQIACPSHVRQALGRRPLSNGLICTGREVGGLRMNSALRSLGSIEPLRPTLTAKQRQTGSLRLCHSSYCVVVEVSGVGVTGTDGLPCV